MGEIMSPCLKVSLSVSLLIGIAMIGTGVVFLVLVLPKVMDEQINENLVLREGSQSAELFANPPVHGYLKFYFFNVLNKDDVNKKGSKPRLEEKGPYVYRQEKWKEIIEWDRKLGLVRYKEHSAFYFEPTMTIGSLDDKINHVNAIALGLAESKQLETILKTVGGDVDQILRSIPGEFINSHTVDELLFRGYNMKEYLPPLLSSVCFLLNDCTFGYYNDRNGSISKEFLVSTGGLSAKNFGEVISYDNQRELTYWFAKTCNAINGTDGKQFSPGVTRDTDLYAFSPDICRSLLLKYEKDVTIEGIDAYRFVVPDYLFEDPNINKDNMCFCQGNVTTPCPAKGGVMPLGPCQGGVPVVASAPHFYQGEQIYRDKFVGLQENKEKHKSFIDIEPITGSVISAAKRIQISMLVQPDPRPPLLKHITGPFYFPVFWVEEGGRIDEKTAAMFRSKVTNPYRTGLCSLIAVIAIGGVIILGSAVVVIIKDRNNKLMKRKY